MRYITVIAIVVAAYQATAQPGKPAAFKDGERVVFAGNSITEAGFYSMYIWQYYQLHFPNRRITVLNGGAGGDVAGQINERFELDILRMKPTTIVLSFGMNDSRYFEYFNTPQEKVREEAVAASLSSFRQLEAKMKALPQVNKIMMTSSPFDESRGGNNNRFTGKYRTMLEIAAFQQRAAEENRWAFVDLLRPMTAINEREQKKDSMFTLTGPDRIHPGNAGHMVMAWIFLREQGLNGKSVADVRIDAKNGKLLRSDNCTVDSIRRGKSGQLSFSYLANSLPFPYDSTARVFENSQKQYEALNLVPFTEEMNREWLVIAGLRKNKQYSLTIDDQQVGIWTGSDFAKGINLALLSSTPQYQQAKQVADLNLQYREYEQKLRAYYWLQANYFKKNNMLFRDDEVALDSVSVTKDWGVGFKKEIYAEARKKDVREQWERSMQEIIEQIYTINKPAVHRFNIIEHKIPQ